MQSKNILVMLIDDDEVQNFLCEETIKKYNPNIEVMAFDQPKKALAHLTGDGRFPDILLLDINMPLVNGWDFVKQYGEIKKVKNNFSTLNMLTSSDSVKDIEQAQDFEEINAFITKPMTGEDFAAIYEFYLNQVSQ